MGMALGVAVARAKAGAIASAALPAVAVRLMTGAGAFGAPALVEVSLVVAGAALLLGLTTSTAAHKAHRYHSK
jgi:hypothetical protein